MFLGRLNMRFATLIAAAALLLATLAGGAAFAAPLLAQATAKPNARASTAHRVHVVLIVMKNNHFVYEPETVVADIGDVIEWKNDDIYVHTVTAVNRTSFDSGSINPKRSWRYKAVKNGTFPYFCTLHPDMKGTLIVR